MVFTAIVPSDLRITPISDEKGRFRAVYCSERATHDGVTTTWYYPSTTGASRLLVEPFLGKVMRLKHISIVSDDDAANSGTVRVFSINTSEYGMLLGWLWTGSIGSTIEIEPDLLMKFDRTLASMSGTIMFLSNSAFTSTKTTTLRAYWEVVE